MSILKESAIAVAALALMLFMGHVFAGPDESYGRAMTGPTSWLGGAAVPPERFLAKQPITGVASIAQVDPLPPSQGFAASTPEARIRGVFGQFEPGGPRQPT